MLPGIEGLELDSILELFSIEGFNLNVPSEALYFTNHSGVSYEDQDYQPIGVVSEGYDLVGQGSIPNPTISVSNIGRVISNFLYLVKTTPGYRLEGSTVKRIVTQKKFLSGQPNQNASIKQFTPDIYALEQVSEETMNAVKFRLSTPFDLEGLSLPSRIALRSCVARYRDGETCPYSGSAMFTLKNEPTLDPKFDVCSKTIAGCKKRFGANAVLPFGGFPSLGLLGS